MGKIIGILKTAIKNSMAYRFDMALTLVVAPVSIIVFYMLWKSIYAYSGVNIIGGFTFHELITYYIVGWIVGVITWTNIPDSLSWEIRNGSIAKEMLKPINVLFMGFLSDVGGRMLALIIEIIPLIIISVILFSFQINLATLPFFLVSLSFSFLLNFLMAAIVGMSAFWLIHNRGLLKLKRVLVHFLSGGLLPLTFFPLWFQKFSYFLPFQYMEFVPINFWLGKYDIMQGFMMLGLQLVWVIIFYFICAFVWNRAVRRVTSVGL